MITVKVFSSRIEAELAKSLLDAYGIFSVITADDRGGLNPAMAFSSGVDLKVRTEDADKAKELLSTKS